MPDLATHLLSSRLLAKANPGWQAAMVPFLFGAVLPDLLTRPLYILFPSLFWLFFPLHAPLPLLFVCYATSMVMRWRPRQTAFIALYLGALLHIGVDLLQKSVTISYAPLFPFSWATWKGGLFWPDQSLLAIPILLALTLGLPLVGRVIRGQK